MLETDNPMNISGLSVFSGGPEAMPSLTISVFSGYDKAISIDMAMQVHYHCRIQFLSWESRMAATLEVESTLTDRYQTTVPESVRRALKLSKRDKIHYTIRSDGEVVLSRAAFTEGDDPVIGQFLGFLARDIAAHPEKIQAVGAGLVQQIQWLLGGIDVDLDTPLSADDE